MSKDFLLFIKFLQYFYIEITAHTVCPYPPTVGKQTKAVLQVPLNCLTGIFINTLKFAMLIMCSI